MLRTSTPSVVVGSEILPMRHHTVLCIARSLPHEAQSHLSVNLMFVPPGRLARFVPC